MVWFAENPYADDVSGIAEHIHCLECDETDAGIDAVDMGSG